MSEVLKIATVVVTYNRLELLKECIDSLRNQTRKIDEIFVINNSSTDGTEKWLSNQKDLTAITQPNSGGAGGFHSGMKIAYEKGFDWIWVMDDDGLPKNDALEELTKYIDGKVGVLNSLVISKERNDKLVFEIEDYKNSKILLTSLNLGTINKNKVIHGANFFNGTLVSNKTIKQIGLPQPLFFIYGDEYEYYLRIKLNAISILTITSSILFHPEQKYTVFGKGKFSYNFPISNKLHIKYYLRNIFVIYFLYKEPPLKRIIKFCIMGTYGLLFYSKDKFSIYIYISSIFKSKKLLREIRGNK